jgi:hypothetical protein
MHADYTTVRDPKQPLLDLGLLRVVACKYARRQREPGPESAECAGDGAGRFEYYSCVVRSVFLFIPYNDLLVHLVRDIDCTVPLEMYNLRDSSSMTSIPLEIFLPALRSRKNDIINEWMTFHKHYFDFLKTPRNQRTDTTPVRTPSGEDLG